MFAGMRIQSRTTRRFWRLFSGLPPEIQQEAKRAGCLATPLRFRNSPRTNLSIPTLSKLAEHVVYDCADDLGARRDREAPQAGVQPLPKRGPTSKAVRTQPWQDIVGLVTNRRADLDVLRPLTKKPPPPDGRDGQARDARHVEFIEKALQPFLCYAFAFAGS